MSQTKRRQSHAQASKTTNQRTIPNWLWLLTGMIVGGFIMFLIHLAELKSLQKTQNNEKPESSATKKQPQIEKVTGPIFEFYDTLKNEQVEIPNYTPPTESTSASQTHEFYLQVASFRQESDADKVRAKLILLNMNAAIETSKLQSGDTRYRVIAGPYQSKSKLAKARQTLVSNGFEFLTLKRPL